MQVSCKPSALAVWATKVSAKYHNSQLIIVLASNMLDLAAAVASLHAVLYSMH